MAVVKSYQPASYAPYGVVFDGEDQQTYDEDLMRKGRTDWIKVQWEGDVVETAELRPLCPNCGIALGEGRRAWTVCTHCGHMEPGIASTGMLNRLRTSRSDPYRRPLVNYADNDDADL